MSALVADKPESCYVEIRNGESWLRLSVCLGEEYVGGPVIRLTPDATFVVDSADELSSAYEQQNWLSGAASGAFYAFRALNASRRVVYLTEFTGRLRSIDMDAVAAATASVLAACLQRDALPVDLEGWHVVSPESSESGRKPVSSVAG